MTNQDLRPRRLCGCNDARPDRTGREKPVDGVPRGNPDCDKTNRRSRNEQEPPEGQLCARKRIDGHLAQRHLFGCTGKPIRTETPPTERRSEKRRRVDPLTDEQFGGSAAAKREPKPIGGQAFAKIRAPNLVRSQPQVLFVLPSKALGLIRAEVPNDNCVPGDDATTLLVCEFLQQAPTNEQQAVRQQPEFSAGPLEPTSRTVSGDELAAHLARRLATAHAIPVLSLMIDYAPGRGPRKMPAWTPGFQTMSWRTAGRVSNSAATGSAISTTFASAGSSIAVTERPKRRSGWSRGRGKAVSTTASRRSSTSS